MLDGQVDIISRDKVEGWLPDRDAFGPAATVAVHVDGAEVGRCRADLPRSVVSEVAGDTGSVRRGFSFAFNPPLSVFRSHKVEVRNAESGHVLGNGRKTYDCPTYGRMPLTPILVTSGAHFGAPALLRNLGRDASVVVADGDPHEAGLVTRYLAAYKALVAQSGAGTSERLADILDQDFPNRLSFLFRDTIQRCYRALSQDRRKLQARCFAEQGDADPEMRLGARMLLGEVREIVVVRDPRDAVWEATTIAGMSLPAALEAIGQTARSIEALSDGADTLVVRYEDLVHDPETPRTLWRFVGLDTPAAWEPERAEADATGRWVRDLDPVDVALCNARFAAFMARFGYGAGVSAGAAAARVAQEEPVVPQMTAPAAAPAAVLPARENSAIVTHDLAGVIEVPGLAGRLVSGLQAGAFAISFGHDGEASRYQDAGWAVGEPGYTWTNATRSLLHLPRPEVPGPYRLCLQLAPFVAPGRLDAQRLAVTANDVPLGEASLTRPSVVEWQLGWDVLSRANPLRLIFDLPDAARPTELTGHPNDSRLLGLSFQRLWLVGPIADGDDVGPRGSHPAPLEATPSGSVQRQPPPPAPASARAEPARAEPAREEPAGAGGPAAAKLMLRFESLGEDGEFGLVQRRSGVEPLGLFRFATIPLSVLSQALATRFEGIGMPAQLAVEISPNGREYTMFERHFGFRYHTRVGVHEKTAEEVLAREVGRLPFLVRKLLADLTEGTKIFVLHGVRPLAQAQAAGLARAIRGFGPGCLLWVELADARHPPGSVLRLGDGLLKGHVDRFAPGDSAHEISLQSWTEVCAAALEAQARTA